jgi:glycosyltransferase involved in cell wall biosynthesis
MTESRIVDDLAALIITYNEEANLERTLSSIAWISKILVVDSGSTDATTVIAARFPQVRVVVRPFDTFASQCNFGLAELDTTWVLSIDADYAFTDELSREIGALPTGGQFSGYRVGFIYCVGGRPLRSTLYPSRCVLYRRDSATYQDEGHGHRVEIVGPVCSLVHRIRHDDRKSLSRWFASQVGYAKREADYILGEAPASLGLNDRLRKMAWPAPFMVFAYTLIVKGCILDGWVGWFYVLQRTLVEIMLCVAIIDRNLRRAG